MAKTSPKSRPTLDRISTISQVAQNPYVLSVDTVRAVNEKGYDAVFAEQWKAELSECDIDPEAVSVDSEAHDMENGRDGLDGNAPEKDAPEKDDRDAQPPVDTDNR